MMWALFLVEKRESYNRNYYQEANVPFKRLFCTYPATITVHRERMYCQTTSIILDTLGTLSIDNEADDDDAS